MGIRVFFFKLLGWKMEGNMPPKDLKKYVIAVGQHTSNWDFPLGISARVLMGLRGKGNFLGKDTLFKFPQGIFFRAMGGIPVDRSKNNNLVDASIETVKNQEDFILVIPVQGTRSKVKKLKTGFWYIAKGANIPIILTSFHADRKVVRVEDPFMPTDFKKDMQKIHQYYLDAVALNPANAMTDHYEYEER